MTTGNKRKNLDLLLSRGVCPMLAMEICREIEEKPESEYSDFVFDWAQILFAVGG